MTSLHQIAEITALAAVLNTSRHVCLPHDEETRRLRLRYRRLVAEAYTENPRLVLPENATLHRNHW